MHNEILKSLFRVLPFLIVIIIIVVLIKKGKINAIDIGLQKPITLTRMLVCIGLFVLYVLATELLLHKYKLLQVEAWSKPLLPSIIIIVGIVLLAPVAEELLFRGLLLFKLTKRMNRHLAIILISIFFVALHNFAYQNSLGSNIGIAQSFIDSVLFSYARYYTKSLYSSMGMHMFGNTVAVVERFVL